jgi:hypothetical protein
MLLNQKPPFIPCEQVAPGFEAVFSGEFALQPVEPEG